MSQERIISPVLKAMIDTMVFDRLLDEPTAVQAVSQAVRDGRLALFTTHVQEDQIAAVPDPLRRKRLQALPREVIPSSVFIVGFSRLNYAALGPGDDYTAVHAGRSKHIADAVIADTAGARCDALITEDARLIKRATERGLEVWTTERLLTWVGHG